MHARARAADTDANDHEALVPSSVLHMCPCSVCIVVSTMHAQVAPKRAALAAAQESLDKTLAELTGAQARLAAVQDKIASLEAAFEAGTAKKAALAAQVTDCQVKLQRADKLIGGLGGERSRWSSTVQQLQAGLDNLVGDVVLAAGQARAGGAAHEHGHD